jgi:endonuclease YncB( thermonuclease family)
VNGTEWQVERVVSVTDGDTVRLVRSRPIEIDGRHYRLVDDNPKGESIRLVWVDTPERGEAGRNEARVDLSVWIAARCPLGKLNEPVGLRVVCYESGGWDRILGDLLDADGNSASQWLMAERGWPAYEKGK